MPGQSRFTPARPPRVHRQRPERSGRRARTAGLRQALDRPLRLEALEDRRLLAAVTVGNALDVVNGNTASIAALIASPGGDGISLREAILAANATAGADVINFAANLSGQTITLGGTELAITEALTIDARPLAENVTIDANQLSRIFNITVTAGDFTLGGLVLTRGRTTSSGALGGGGAIRSVTSGLLTIDQSTVSGSSTAGNDARGGGIFSSGPVTLTGSAVSGNSTAGVAAHGGGIWASGALTLNDSAVSGNRTEGEFAAGGAIVTFAGASVTINRSAVNDNRTTGTSAFGGGIMTFSGGPVTLTQSTVMGNSTVGEAAFGGGIDSDGDLTLTHSIVSGNRTTGESAHGGGARASGNLTLTQSTVSGNSTAGANARGGGLYALTTMTLTQSTVTGNSTLHATADGGGAFQVNLSANHPFVVNGSIVAGNTAGADGPDMKPDPDSPLTVRYSLVGNTSGSGVVAGTGPGNLLNVAPQLAPLANNGGPTQTHALLATSPALNAGDPSIAAGSDQRGAPFARVAGGRIDIGAYERQTLGNPALFVVTTTDDEFDYANEAVSLREAINSANGSVGADVITFAPALSGQTITLGGTEFEITEALTIDARPLAQNVTIDADQKSRIFNITATTGDFTLGGLTLTGGRTTGDNSGFADNVFNGGAIRSLTIHDLTLIKSTVTGNRTEGEFADGGGIYASRVTLIESTVSANRTTGTDAWGGGIVGWSRVTLTASSVSGNSTEGDFAHAGGISSGGLVTLTQSTVSENRTLGSNARGGGIWTTGAVTLTDSTVSGNSTAGAFAHGGGMRANGAVTLIRSTVTQNHALHAAAMGGGVYQVDAEPLSAPVTISGSILAGNSAGGGGPDLVPNPGGVVTVNYSLIGTGITPADGSNNVASNNPQLAPLANNGGPTRTHALLAASPAINAGDPSVVTPFDQRGAPFMRVAGGRVDIGAYERQTVAGLNLVVDTAVDENDGDYSPGDLSLREAIGLANGSVGTNTITFIPPLSGQTIALVHGELAISEALTIDALSTGSNVAIDARGQSRIFHITATTGNFNFGGLTLTGGRTTAEGDAGQGGAIRSTSTGTLTVVRSTLSGNSVAGANAAGGALLAYGPVTLTNTTVSGNTAEGNNGGGGGLVAFGTLVLTRSTISGNRTTGEFSNGGGIRASGAVTLTESTVTDNHAQQSSGGGVFQLNMAANHPFSINGSIVAGNSASVSNGGAANLVSDPQSTLTINYSLVGAGITPTAGGNNVVNNNPQLAPLGNYGGPTPTHALLAASPAINAGDPTIATGNDQRGAPFARVADGRSDIGAYERQTIPAFSLVVTTAVDENDGNYAPADLSLREAIGLHNGGAGAGVITFAPALAGATITLSGTELVISQALAINAPSLAPNVTIDADRKSRIFNVTATTGDFAFRGLTITGGRTTEEFLAGTGGGVRSVTAGTLTFERSMVHDNRTSGTGARGGGIWTNGGGVTLINSTVSDNHTSGDFADGGGIRSLAHVTLTQSTVSGNTTSGNTSRGGGIYAVEAVTISHSTIADNHVTGPNGSGGGVHQWNSPTENHPVSIVGSIVAGNTTLGVGIDLMPDATSPVTATHSVVGVANNLTFAPGSTGNQTGTAANRLDPQLAPLANNGGQTWTHALLAGSPAINAGDPAAAVGVGGVTPFDQRGGPFVRIAGGRIDVGSFEATTPPPLADFNSSSRVDGFDFLIWQRGFGATDAAATLANGNADYDNDVDGDDLAVWKSQFGESQSVAEAITAPTDASLPMPESRALSPALADAALAYAYQQMGDGAPAWRPLRPRLLRPR